ncbi:hypothetical protein CR513_45050, partial [Mucuna pruriens]
MVKSTTKRSELVSPISVESPSLSISLDDMTREIFLELPMRSLLQFRSICKSWKTLISNAQFAKDHLHTSTANPNMAHLQLVPFLIGPDTIKSYSVHILLQNPTTPTKHSRFEMICWVSYSSSPLKHSSI